MCEALSMAAKKLPTTNTWCTFPRDTQCSLPQVCGGDHHCRVSVWGRRVFILLRTGSRMKKYPRRDTALQAKSLCPSSPTVHQHPVMNQRCIQTVLFSICLCACFFGSLLFYQHKCEGKRCEQKIKRRAKASCTVHCLPWDALVKLRVTVIPSESHTRKPSGGRGWASIRHLPHARFFAQCFIISVPLDTSIRWFSM